MTFRRPNLRVSKLLLLAAALAWNATEAQVPTTDTPPVYAAYGAIADPGAGAADYFQPFWYDTDGRHIQAHGGQVVAVEENGQTVHYWFGEDRTNGYSNQLGVTVYRSTDTYSWTNEGLALRAISDASELTDPYFDALYDTVAEDGTPNQDRIDKVGYYLNTNPDAPLTAIFERPKMLYNESNDTWVMWWHADGQTSEGGSYYARSLAAVAVSDSPTGPFRLTGAYRLYNREDYKACAGFAAEGQARDMTVFKDDDGTAYVIYSSEENYTLYVARLNSDYTNVERTTSEDITGGIQYSEDGVYPYVFADGSAEAPVRGVDFQIVKECGHLEAPALFQHGGKYYVVTSGATGWAPNPATYYSADSILGDWIRGVVAGDAYENVRYDSIPEGGDGLLSIGDARKTTFGSQPTNVIKLGPGKYIYMGDRWKSGAPDSTYVWLPITIGEGGALQMRNPADEDPERWGDGWDHSYWDDKGLGDGVWTVDDGQVPSVVRRSDNAVLPDTVAVTANGITSDVEVVWDAPDFTMLGRQTITGTLAAADGFGPGRTFTRELWVWDYGQLNLAPSASVVASSRNELAGRVVDGNVSGKGWDDWSSSGYPLDSTLTFSWSAAKEPSEVVVYAYNDGRASWPSYIAVEYLDADGSWVTSGVAADVDQIDGPAPVVVLDASTLPATTALRLRLLTETNTWQSISEVVIWGQPSESETTNLCRTAGATVAASFHQTDYETWAPSDACDGSTGTYWSTWSSGLANTPDEVTFTVETPFSYLVEEGLSFTNTEGGITAVGVEYRDTDGVWRDTTAQGIAPNANGQLTEIPFDPVEATGMRLTFATPGSYLKISELSIPVIAPLNVSAGATVTASFYQTRYETLPGSNAADGSASTVWSTWTDAGFLDEVSLQIDATTAYRIEEASFTNTEGAIAGVSIDYRGTDGVWRSTTAQNVPPNGNGQVTTLAFDPVFATGLRFTFATPGSYLKIAEIAIPGELAAPPAWLAVTGGQTILAGDELPLDVSADPENGDATVTWSTSDASIATVDDSGVVTGQGYGAVAITATSVADAAVTAATTVSVLPDAEEWSSSAAYDTGDLVFYQGAVYKALWWAKAGAVPGASTRGAWAEIGAMVMCGSGNYPSWTATSVYDEGDAVVHDGQVWKALWYARGDEPGDPHGPWADRGACEPEGGASDAPVWTPTMVYNEGDVVAFEGHLWGAKWWTRNDQPGDPNGPWEDLGPIED